MKKNNDISPLLATEPAKLHKVPGVVQSTSTKFYKMSTPKLTNRSNDQISGKHSND